MNQDPQIALLLELIKQHAEDDTRRFAAVQRSLDEIATDVKSLVSSRDRGRGAWKATAAIAGAAGSIGGALVGWLL